MSRDRAFRWRLTIFAVALALVPLGAVPARAQNMAAAPAPDATDDGVAALRALQGDDARLLAVGTRLAMAGVGLCPAPRPLLGLSVHDLSQYALADQPAARIAFGLGDAPAVLAVAPGGPADAAGVRADDAILAIDGAAPPRRAAQALSFARTGAVLDRLDRAAAVGAVTLTLARRGERIARVLSPRPGCVARFQTRDGADPAAEADGLTIEVTSALLAIADTEPALAAVLGHELAHNILHHRDRLDALRVNRDDPGARDAALIRETEIEADRLGVYLVDRAGYPVDAIAEYWRRQGDPHWPHGPARTHPAHRARIAIVRAEIGRIARMKAEGREPRPAFLDSAALQLPSAPPGE